VGGFTMPKIKILPKLFDVWRDFFMPIDSGFYLYISYRKQEESLLKKSSLTCGDFVPQK
jgi:hypothetical protein